MAACVLSRTAPTSLSACDMGTSFSSKAVDGVCLVSAESVLGTGFVAVPWVSDRVRIHAEVRGNATVGTDQRGEQDLQLEQGWDKL